MNHENVHRKRILKTFQLPPHNNFIWHNLDRREHLRVDIQKWLNFFSEDDSISFDWLGSPLLNAFAYCEPKQTFNCIGISIGSYLRMNLICSSLLAHTAIFDQHFLSGKRDRDINHDLNLPRIIAMSYDELRENMPMNFSDHWRVVTMLEDRIIEFMFAHELAHIMLGHVNRLQNVQRNNMWSSLQHHKTNQGISLEEIWMMELSADQLATDIIFETHFRKDRFLGESTFFRQEVENEKDDFLFCFLVSIEILMQSIHLQRKKEWSNLSPNPVSGYPTPWLRYQAVLNRSIRWMGYCSRQTAHFNGRHWFSHEYINSTPILSQLKSIRESFLCTGDENLMRASQSIGYNEAHWKIRQVSFKYGHLYKHHPLFGHLLRFLDSP